MKKGQITAFFVVGILLVIVFVLINPFKAPVKDDPALVTEMNEVSVRVDKYIDECLQVTLRKGMDKYGLRTDDLQEYTVLHLTDCLDDFSVFRRSGYDFLYSVPIIKVTKERDVFSEDMTFLVTMTKEGQKKEIHEFSGKVMIPEDFKNPLDGYEKRFCGIYIKKESLKSPRPLDIVRAKVDLDKPCISFYVTPGPQSYMTTSAFMSKYGVQLAINGGGGNEAGIGNPSVLNDQINGYSASEGNVYSDPKWKILPVATLTISKDNKVSLSGSGDAYHAITGMNDIVLGGEVIERFYPGKPLHKPAYDNLEPRTSVGIDNEFNWLNLLVIDGRNAGVSEGVSLLELAQMHVEMGSDIAANFDGGGSTTIVVEEGASPKVLNTPSDGNERRVPNHLGVYSRP